MIMPPPNMRSLSFKTTDCPEVMALCGVKKDISNESWDIGLTLTSTGVCDERMRA